MRQIRPRDRQPHRLGPGGEQEPVVGNAASVGEPHLARPRLDAGDLRAEPQVDAVLRIERGAAQRHPRLGRGAGEIVLGEVGPVDGRSLVVAEHDDAALVARVAAASAPRRSRQPRRRRSRSSPGRRCRRRARAWPPASSRPRRPCHRALPPTSTRAGSAPERARLRRSADRSRRGARGSGRCRPPPARRRGDRRSGVHSAPIAKMSASAPHQQDLGSRRHGRRASRRPQARRPRPPRPDRVRPASSALQPSTPPPRPCGTDPCTLQNEYPRSCGASAGRS